MTVGTATIRHLLRVGDLQPGELRDVLDAAERPDLPPILAGRGVALVFEKPSARTRNSTEMAVVHLGGHPLSMAGGEVGLDVRETAEDLVRTLACYHAAVGARVFAHTTLTRMAAVSPVPVLNLLSDVEHPLQALADLLTLRQRWGSFDGRCVAWVGDFNNTARSVASAAALAGLGMRVATPVGYGPTREDLAALGDLVVTTEPSAAVAGVDAVITDTWTSMGQEAEAAGRREDFAAAGFIVDASLMARAAPGAVFLHCLPAHRGEEVTAEVIEGPASLIWQEVANRLAVARGVLWWLLGRPSTCMSRR